MDRQGGGSGFSLGGGRKRGGVFALPRAFLCFGVRFDCGSAIAPFLPRGGEKGRLAVRASWTPRGRLGLCSAAVCPALISPPCKGRRAARGPFSPLPAPRRLEGLWPLSLRCVGTPSFKVGVALGGRTAGLTWRLPRRGQKSAAAGRNRGEPGRAGGACCGGGGITAPFKKIK